jgi:arsenate reductase (glutaredoxin)
VITIYHNNRCGKSRAALELLEASGKDYQIRYYLADPLSLDELRALQRKLELPALEMMRCNEKLFKELYQGQQMEDEAWLTVISQHPILLERAIVETAQNAVIARPPERVREIL